MAKKKTAKKTGVSNAQKVGIGVGLTTAAVAAAGAYFLYGSKDAAANRKKVKGWALKAKGEVLEALEKAENITEAEFNALVDRAAKTYGKVQNLSQREVDEFKREMTRNWKALLSSGAVKAISNATKNAKVAAQKAPAKKAPAKKSAAKKAPAKKAAKKSS